MAHVMHHSVDTLLTDISDWCIGCTNLNGKRVRIGRNGALCAPFQWSFPQSHARTVHVMHQLGGFFREHAEDWCTGCTIPAGNRAQIARNGAYDAPFSCRLPPIRSGMVYLMHHFRDIQSESARDWYTGCTILRECAVATRYVCT